MTAVEPIAKDEDREAIQRAVADYCEGYYRRNQEQTFRAYHPECLKRAFERNQFNVYYLIVQTRASMVDVAGIRERSIENPEFEIIIDEVLGDMSTVRLYSNNWVDYLHVVKARDEWKLLHAAYDEPSESGSEASESDLAAVHHVAQEYIESWYAGDAPRHLDTYHDEYVRRVFLADGSLEVTSGQRMADLCAAKGPDRSTTDWSIQIDGICGDVATVRIRSSSWTEFLHLARARGTWGLFHGTYHDEQKSRSTNAG